jgi:hypothetical protein
MVPPGTRSGALVECPRCGAGVSDEDAFCGECGAAVEKPMAPPPPPPPLVASPVPVAPAAPVDGGSLTADDPLRGTAVANEVYQGQRLTYDPDRVQYLDPMSSAVGHEMWRQAKVHLMAAVLVCLILSPLLLAMGANAASTIFALLLLGFLLLYLFKRVPVGVSEWRFLVDDKGAAGPSAFEHIAWSLRRRGTPIDSMNVKRLGQHGGRSQDYLEIREGIFTGYVSCFAYGGDLFIAWTFWLRISPFRRWMASIGRLWQTLTLRGSFLHVAVRYDRGKALREAIHSAAREGIDVAAGKVSAKGAGTIGSDIPVELVTAADTLPPILDGADGGQAGR